MVYIIRMVHRPYVGRSNDTATSYRRLIHFSILSLPRLRTHLTFLLSGSHQGLGGWVTGGAGMFDGLMEKSQEGQWPELETGRPVFSDGGFKRGFHWLGVINRIHC